MTDELITRRELVAHGVKYSAGQFREALYWWVLATLSVIVDPIHQFVTRLRYWSRLTYSVGAASLNLVIIPARLAVTACRTDREALTETWGDEINSGDQGECC